MHWVFILIFIYICIWISDKFFKKLRLEGIKTTSLQSIDEARSPQKGKAFIIHKAKGSRYARRILSSLHFSRFFLSLESRERKTQRGERKREATPKVKGSWGGKVSVGNAAESSEGQFGHFYAHLRHFRRRTLVIGDGDFQCWISHRRHGLRRTRLDRCRCLFH